MAQRPETLDRTRNAYGRTFNVKHHPSQTRRLSSQEAFLQTFSAGELTADELLRCYCTVVYAQTGSYEETARRLQIDRRTVKSKIDAELLEQLSKNLGN